MNNASVKFENHFKLYIPFRDKIIFESELINNNIEFYFEENQPNINVSVKYFLKDSDANEIDKIIRKNEIISSIENQNLDYQHEQKIQKLYLKVAIAIILIFLFASAAISYFK
jgi:hypothetical protein